MRHEIDPRLAPSVSVVMPVHNAARYLRRAMESVLAQSYADFELLALDDGSSDASVNVLRVFAQRDPRVRLYALRRQGLVATLNLGIELARGRWIARMDADDISAPARFRQQVDWLEANPDGVAVGCQVLMVDPHGLPLTYVNFPLGHGAIVARLLGGRGGLPHPGSMFTREAASRVGGYDARFEAAEDVDFFLKLSCEGRMVNLPQVLLQYRVHVLSESSQRALVQQASARAAAAKGRATRGMAPVPQAGWPERVVVHGRVEHHRRWCRWALKAGYLRSARRHALTAALFRPLWLSSWRLLWRTLRGY